MQIEDGVGDDTSCFLLVSPGRHHEYGDAPLPRSPEHDLISLYDALAEKERREKGRAVSLITDAICIFSEF